MAERAPASIDRNIEQIKDTLRAAFQARGEAHVHVTDIRVSLDEWRKLARAVAREIGRPVETVATEGRAWAVLRDWPADDRETRIHEKAMRDVMNAAAKTFPTGPRLHAKRPRK